MLQNSPPNIPIPLRIHGRTKATSRKVWLRPPREFKCVFCLVFFS